MPPRKNKLPALLPEGFIVNDTNKKSWRLGKKLGQGGFGLIYLASPDCDRPVPDDTAYVIKVENYQNGPLFCELKFYQRAAKPEDVTLWIHRHNLDYLGIPRYWGTGELNYNSSSYRFMVVDRLGTDLQKMQNNNSGRLPAKTVMQIGIRMLDVLEYIHEHEYVHGDIKAGNILLHSLDASKVYLADYGLSYRYCPNGKHKEYKEDPRKCHNGTIEFTSRDAHKGVAPSRRGDLEILAYCMLNWLSGKLPWDHSLRDPSTVLASKTKLWDDLPNSVIKSSGEKDGCQGLAKFMAEVSLLSYDEKPNYAELRRILCKALYRMGTSLSSQLLNSLAQSFQKQSVGGGKKNHSQKTAVSTHRNQDAGNFGTRSVKEDSSSVQKTSHADFYPDIQNIHKPMRKPNVSPIHNYNKAGDKIPWNTDPSDVLERSDPELHEQHRQDIYKYGLAGSVLLLMIYYLIYVL